MPAGRFHAAGKVHLSCIVTSKMSFQDCRDVLPIVRFSGNAYRAPRIVNEPLGELQGGILEP
jgi:hypothetical protein